MKTKEPIAVLTTELGTVAFQEQVFTTLVKESMKENESVLAIELNQLKRQKIQIASGEAANEVSLTVSVKLRGPVRAIQVCQEIQECLMTEVSNCLGVVVTEVILNIEDIIY